MSNKKIDKATAIKSILSDLKKGIDKPTILGRFGKKWEIPKSTYYRWFDDAEKQYNEYVSRITPKIEEKEAEAIGEARKLDILSIAERQKILSDIAQGNITITKPVVVMGTITQAEVMPDFSDRKAAIAELNKMDGSYAATKIDQTNINIDAGELTPDEIKKINNNLESTY